MIHWFVTYYRGKSDEMRHDIYLSVRPVACPSVCLSVYPHMVEFFELLYPLFSLEKKGILNLCQSRSVVGPSVRPSITFLVNVSPPKPLEVATSNFVVE